MEMVNKLLEIFKYSIEDMANTKRLLLHKLSLNDLLDWVKQVVDPLHRDVVLGFVAQLATS